MLDQVLTKEIVSSLITIVISIVIYLIIKQLIIKMFKASKKYGIHKKSITITNLIINIIKYIIIIIAVLTILNFWGVDTKALVASLGVVGVIAGLAMQDILKDFLAGFSIIVDNEFDVGDNIKIGTFRGTVIELGIKNTKIRAYSGEVLTIANRNINEVINYSTQSSKSIVDISVDYNADLEKTEEVIKKVCETLSKQIPYLTSDVELLGIEKLDDSAVIYRIVADCEPTMDIPFKREVHKAIKLAFDENKLNIPFPQVVVHNE